MPILSVCHILQNDTDYGFLTRQDWTDTELVVCGNQNQINQFLQSLSSFVGTSQPSTPNIAIKTVLSTATNNSLWACIQNASGEFITWLSPTETWQNNFLNEAKNFLKLNQRSSGHSILYAYGFVKSNEQRLFCTDVVPALRLPNRLFRNISNPTFFVPCMKYFWAKNIIQTYNIAVYEPQRWVLSLSLFAIDYMAALWEINNFNEPEYISTSLNFEVDIKTTTFSRQYLPIYQDKVKSKRELWQKNMWTMLYWLTKFELRKEKPEG